MFFTNAWMLAGLAALSIPVVIHLLLRRKKKRARFSTLQFFVRHDDHASQRRKLRNWLLLALRLLVCALLVLAFARPYLSGGETVGAERTRRVVLLLDRSLSMHSNPGDGSKWDRAIEAAREIVGVLRANDRVALVGCAAVPEVLSEWAPPSAIAKRLDEIKPTFGGSNLGQGLEQSKRLLASAESGGAAVVYLISDFQRASSHNLSAHLLPADVELKTVPIGDPVTPNIALADLQVEPADGVLPHAIVASFSDEHSPQLKVELSVGNTLISSGTMALKSGTTTNLDLALPVLKPGWHGVTVRLHGADALGKDDTRFETVFVPPPARALVVETRPSQRAYEEETFFITTALDPGKDSTNAVRSRFVFERVLPQELPKRLEDKSPESRTDFIVLPALRQFSAELGKSLVDYVQSGGGLLLFLGEGISANRYSAELGAVLPLRLGAAESQNDLASAWRIAGYDTNLVIFGAFQELNSGNLSLPRFTKRLDLSVDDRSLVAAQFTDGMPLMVARQVGGGRIVLVNTSIDSSWNDWPKHKSYVPWVHGVGLYLANLSDQKTLHQKSRITAGEVVDIDLGPGAAMRPFKIGAIKGAEQLLVADTNGIVRDISFAAPGIYSLFNEAGDELRRIAVNVPSQESDLSAPSANELQQQLTRVPEVRTASLAAGLFGAESNHREIWRVLLLAVMLLLVVEMVLANRTLA